MRYWIVLLIVAVGAYYVGANHKLNIPVIG